jgi:membrane-bound inhibitor of C-type lysozyme
MPNLWPWGAGNAADGKRIPANATAYHCDGGKTFYVRYLDDGAAWIFFPERQVRLEKTATTTGARYSNGIATLEVDGAAATLTDGPSVSYLGCKKPTTSQ